MSSATLEKRKTDMLFFGLRRQTRGAVGNSSKSRTPAIASSEKGKLISSTIKKAAKKGEKTE
ncbi:hypothetical protein U1Q18_022630, partial [Sarracenia purpurea var. burkii]